MAKRSAGGLGDEAVQALRIQLSEGKRPRVRLSGPQFSDGATGTVTRIGNPDIDGADFITVRVTVNGAADELVFAPAELEMQSRGRAAAARNDKAPTPPRKQSRAVRPALAKSDPIRAQNRSSRRRPGPPPKITISISSVGAVWTVTALRGAKSVAKGVPIPPGVVTAIATLLEQPSIADAVAEVNETSRAEAELRAATLRAELSELEAVLATHRAPR
jgi:hypothetical protein